MLDFPLFLKIFLSPFQMEAEEGVAAVVDWLVAGTVADIAGVDILAVAR